MSVRLKLTLLLGAFVSTSIALWGAKYVAYTLDPIVRVLHG